jgi:hypothetical protein
VKAFIEATIKQVRASGVSRTLFGRLRPIPDNNSRNPNARGFAERTAVNSPLQGTAADLIKLAMIASTARSARAATGPQCFASARRTPFRSAAGGGGRGGETLKARDGERAQVGSAAHRGCGSGLERRDAK